MTDLAIFAVSGALVTLGVIALGWRLASSERDRGEKAGQIAVLTSERDTYKDKASAEGKRADALDDLIADHVGGGPNAGDFERLRDKWRAARKGPDAAGGVGPAVVPPASAAAAPDLRLVKPGDV